MDVVIYLCTRVSPRTLLLLLLLLLFPRSSLARLFAKRAARDSLDRTYRVSPAEGTKTRSGEVMGALSARANRDKRTFVLPIKPRTLFNNFASAPAHRGTR